MLVRRRASNERRNGSVLSKQIDNKKKEEEQTSFPPSFNLWSSFCAIVFVLYGSLLAFLLPRSNLGTIEGGRGRGRRLLSSLPLSLFC